MNNSKTKRVLAISGVVLLLGLYVAALILAFVNNAFAHKILFIALAGTFFIPILIYVIMMFAKLNRRDNPSGDSQDEK